jgi:hypothetical protein
MFPSLMVVFFILGCENSVIGNEKVDISYRPTKIQFSENNGPLQSERSI